MQLIRYWTLWKTTSINLNLLENQYPSENKISDYIQCIEYKDADKRVDFGQDLAL